MLQHELILVKVNLYRSLTFSKYERRSNLMKKCDYAVVDARLSALSIISFSSDTCSKPCLGPAPLSSRHSQAGFQTLVAPPSAGQQQGDRDLSVASPNRGATTAGMAFAAQAPRCLHRPRAHGDFADYHKRSAMRIHHRDAAVAAISLLHTYDIAGNLPTGKARWASAGAKWLKRLGRSSLCSWNGSKHRNSSHESARDRATWCWGRACQRAWSSVVDNCK
jgi:hypothetical protein